jgi:hypothetical protein
MHAMHSNGCRPHQTSTRKAGEQDFARNGNTDRHLGAVAMFAEPLD